MEEHEKITAKLFWITIAGFVVFSVGAYLVVSLFPS